MERRGRSIPSTARGEPITEPSPVRRRTSRGKKLLFAAVVAVLSVALAEGAARVYEMARPSRVVDYGRGFTSGARVFVPIADRPGFVTTGPGKDAFFRVQTFQAKKPAGTFRIAVLGGSSVYRMETEFRRMEAELAAALTPRFQRVEVLNAGGLSYGSARLVGVALEMIEYEPDVVVLYEANNEFVEMQEMRFAEIEDASVFHSLSWSALIRVTRDMAADRQIAMVRNEVEQMAQRGNATPDPSLPPGMDLFIVTPDQVDARMAAFRRNYEFIARLCRRAGAQFILGAVPSNLVRPYLFGASDIQYSKVRGMFRSGQFEEGDALGRKLLSGPICRHQASDAENSIIRAIAAEMDVPLADVESAVRAAEPHHVPGETLFSDHCHLNDAGNAIFRETLVHAVLAAVQAPDRSASQRR